jgi:hypothetical protein
MPEFCFTHSNSRYGETFYSFVNASTSDGTPQRFVKGLLKAVNGMRRQVWRRRRA